MKETNVTGRKCMAEIMPTLRNAKYLFDSIIRM